MKQSIILEMQLDALNEEDRKLKESFRKEIGDDPRFEWFKKYLRSGGDENRKKREKLEFDIKREKNREIDVGDGVTVCLYSDRHACTVVKRTKTTLVAQRDKAILDPSFKPEFITDGFSAYCTNSGEQRYTYERDEHGDLFVCHWSEKKGRFQSGSDGSIKIVIGRSEYYDYNF